MKAYVFTDKALARHAGRFVWLSIDTEQEKNAGFVEKFPVEAWPTLMVIDPATEAPALRWLGSVTVAQMDKLLADGERAVREQRAQGGSGLDTRLAEADRAYAAQDHETAVKLLGALRKDAPADWPSRPRVVETLLYSQQHLGQNAECFQVALEEVPKLGRTPSYANAAAVGVYCGLELPKDTPNRAQGMASLEAAVKDALASDIQMAADDRSGLYDAIHSAREDAGDEAGARKVAEDWAAFLEGEAAKAKNPQQRAVFDPHRLGVYLALGRPEKAIPMLEQSEKDLPNDYNPPARLAVAYREAGKFTEALAASDRALQKAYGPRKVRVFLDRAQIYRKQKDYPNARKTLEAALEFAKALPDSQRHKGMIPNLQKQLDELPGVPSDRMP